MIFQLEQVKKWRKMTDTRQIKMLQTKLEKEKQDFDVLQLEVSNKQKELAVKQRSIQSLKNAISQMNHTDKVKISEHALLRYFERVLGFDLKEVEQWILTDEVQNMIKTLGGNGKYPNEKFTVVMKNYTVTTIIN
jgi:hypothetical protein